MIDITVSPRQAEILRLAADGRTDKEIAAHLGCAHRTVRTHIEVLKRRHGHGLNRTALVAAWAYKQGRAAA